MKLVKSLPRKSKDLACSFTFPSCQVDFKGKSTMAEGDKPAEPAPEGALETTNALAEADAPVEAPVLKNLVILPPLQKKGISSRDELLDAVPLPPIRAEEPVSSIRAALSEVVGYAHLTNYRFVLEETVERPTTVQRKAFVVSPYTGTNAVVSVPTAIKSLEKEPQVANELSLVLDDYGDLTSLVKSGLKDGSAFRVVLERYDTALIRDHVGRLRSLLEGNAPSASSLDEGGSVGQPDGEQAETAAEDTKPDDVTSEPKKEEEKSGEEKNKEEAAVKEKAQQEAFKNLATYPVGKSVALDGKNLKDFFYLACGEDPALYSEDAVKNANSKKENGSKKSKKKNKKHKEEDEEAETDDLSAEAAIREVIPRLNILEEKTRVKCTIRLSGFHPPPPPRRLMGDLSYLEISLPGEKDVIHITAIPTGFYVNRSSSADSVPKFDPSPAVKPCFSHELLDCLLQCSFSLSTAWEEAMIASKERAELMAMLNKDGPFLSLFRVAIRGDFKGYTNPSTASAAEGIDALLQSPTWLVPIPKAEEQSEDSWTRNSVHKYNPARTEDELSNSFGVDIRSGAVRDWNEELQSAREMSIEFLPERIERARVLNKVLMDFGEASLLGVRAISDGQIAPMNPNESTRSQVYLHNNIFFSRAVDAGVETFKVAKGDKAARKSASRDVHCLGALHRMERSGLHTLATVLVDFLGTRFVCQSILPGILSGEKTHTLLYGAVEAGSPLMWDKEMHELLENTLGKSLMIATRPFPREPLTDERAAEIEAVKSASSLYLDRKEEEKKEEEASKTISVCAPIEAKGIQGSDKRKYVLDMTRLTPRDANWVPESKGGTGKWESLLKSSGSSKKSSNIPKDLEDDEWTLSVLRPELVTSYTQAVMTKYLQNKKAKEIEEKEAEKAKIAEESAKDPSEDKTEKSEEAPEKSAEEKKTNAEKEAGEEKEKAAKSALTDEDLDYLKSLRFNINVFLPDIKSLAGIDDCAVEQIKNDEEMTRKAAAFLWEETLPGLTNNIRQGSGHQIPQDGRSLTEFIHQHGINCRYMGQLAELARKEEEKDRKQLEEIKASKGTKLERRTMPRFWLELLECEMVARSAKHVLDSYLTENGGTAANSPAQSVASFFSALISGREESAAETETRMGKRSSSEPDEDDFNALTMFNTGGEGDAVQSHIRGRSEVWADIEKEVGRRFRTTLTVFNNTSNASRALFVPLLRRVCQRTGVRLAAKNYEFGGKCHCSISSGGRITASHPITPLDIIDIVPLMKHSAAHGEGFVPCGLGAAVGLPPLHISLPDARQALEAAHLHHSGRALSRALDLAQEACGLYQRVTETPAHPGVVRCIDLMATILFDAGEADLAAANAMKALGLLVQIGGFDSPDVIGAHLVLFQMLLTAGQVSNGVKHLKAALYLMEVLGGPRNVELSNAYHKLGTVFHGVNDLMTALKFYQEAAARESCDRLLEGMIRKSTAMVLATNGDYKTAVENERRAFELFSILLGPNHQLTTTSDQTLKQFMTLAVESGNKRVFSVQQLNEEEKANAIADEIAAEVEAEEEKKKKKNKKKKGGKK